MFNFLRYILLILFLKSLQLTTALTEFEEITAAVSQPGK